MTIIRSQKIYYIVIVSAFLSWCLLSLQKPLNNTKAIETSKESPDFFSMGYHKIQLDSNGFAKNELLADKMSHYKFDGSTHLEKPVMNLFNSSGILPWLIKADSGVLAEDGDNLELIGQTIINREKSKDAKALTILTSDLHVKLTQNFAQTDNWAEIISAPNKTSGSGMDLTFSNPLYLKLYSKVKGRYELK